MSQRRPTIGVIISSLHEAYQAIVWSGICETAKLRDVDLISFVATSQDKIDSLDMHFQVVRDFALNSKLDGLIIFAGTIAEFTDPTFVSTYCREFSHIPMSSISFEVPDVPGILGDNTAGIVELVDHFVSVHKAKRIAFVKGPEGHDEAEERFAAYKFGLDKNNIPYDPALVFPGHFSQKSGAKAAASLCSRGIEFDAILAVDDETAFGVVGELKRRGIHVPTDVAIAGFDDVDEASLVLPSLTTVRQPLYRIGAESLDVVLKQIDGDSVSPLTVLPTQAVYRRSCGCFPRTIRESTPPKPYGTEISKDEMVEAIFGKVGPLVGDDPAEPSEISELVKVIVERFEEDAKISPVRNNFLNALDTFLFKVEGRPGNTEAMQTILFELSGYLNALFKDYLHLTNGNNLLQQAQVLLREYKLKANQTKNMQESAFQLKIRETSQKIITTFEQGRLLHTIAAEFPDININTLVFALYGAEGFALTMENWAFPKESNLLIAYDKAQGIHVGSKDALTFDTSEIVPKSLRDPSRPGNYIFMPLFFKNEQFGFIVFDYMQGQPLFMYEELRLHIGSSLKSSFMMQELKVQSMGDELTGLYNRRGFITLSQKMIESAKRNGGRMLIFYADLDKLKMINDTYGHEEGDVAIVGAASVLSDTFRKQDVIGRIGGDEFIVILSVDSSTDLEASIMARLRKKLDDYNNNSNRPYTLSMTIGSSYYNPNDGKSLDEIIKEADDRLMAKKRNRQ